jgi:hypothetical protein
MGSKADLGTHSGSRHTVAERAGHLGDGSGFLREPDSLPSFSLELRS